MDSYSIHFWGLAKCETCLWHVAREPFRMELVACMKVLWAGKACQGTPYQFLYNLVCNGDWPSGKAPGSGPDIGGSNPSSPAMYCTKGDL